MELPVTDMTAPYIAAFCSVSRETLLSHIFKDLLHDDDLPKDRQTYKPR